MKDKEAIIWKPAFSLFPKNTLREPRIPAAITHLSITQEQVYNAFIAQSTQKAPGPDKINFEILCIIWNWKNKKITQIVKQVIHLGYHPKE